VTETTHCCSELEIYHFVFGVTETVANDTNQQHV